MLKFWETIQHLTSDCRKYHLRILRSSQISLPLITHLLQTYLLGYLVINFNWWISSCLWLWPGSWRCTWSNFSTQHLLTTNPSSLLISCVEPWGYNFLRQLHVPSANQMLVETLIPHKTTTMVWSIWYSCEKTSFRLGDYFAVLVNEPVSIHVGHTS